MFFETGEQAFRGLPEGGHAPVVRELPADVLTPVGAAHRLFRSGEPCFLLESAAGGEHVGRYSFVGRSASTSHDARRDGPDFAPFLAAHSLCPGAVLPFPLPAAAVGYVAWDMVRHWEGLGPPRKPTPVADVLLHHFQDLVVFDHLKQRMFLVHLLGPGPRDGGAWRQACARLDAMAAALHDPDRPGLALRPAGSPPGFSVSPDDGEFIRRVRRIQEYILSGDAYQVVLSRTFRSEYTGDPLNLYRALRMVNPSPFMFYLDMGDHQVIGASPEDLVRVSGRRVETLPIAGTRARGRTPEQDQALALELLADPKEKAEHMMLVDLGRNDLGRVCSPGTVRVERLMEVERFSHVMHLVSRVSGHLRDGVSAERALEACFPAGTVSGAPKRRAMEIIDELEDSPRGVYAGAAVYFDGRGDLDACIAIRTLHLGDGVVRFNAGAGIVADSEPAAEEAETRNKAGALLAALELAGRLA